MSSGTTEFLDYTGPAQKDISVTNSGIRWNSKTLVGDVHKFNSQLIIPPFSFNSYPENGEFAFRPSTCVGQFNYSIGQNFSILFDTVSIAALNTWVACHAILRYRVGTVGYRYILPILPANLFALGKVFFPIYNGQLIRGNFTIEIWGITSVVSNTISSPNQTILNTSILSNTGALQYPPAAFVRHQDINAVLPIALPYVWNANQAWLSN